MKLSWSHRLFLRINAYTKRYVWVDRFMYGCSVWGIFLLLCLVFGTALLVFADAWHMVFFGISFCLAFFFSLSVNWLIGWLFPHPRPLVEFPHIVELVQPMSHWKAFPSDHTTIAWLLALFACFFFSTYIVFCMCCCAFALLIGIGRVYTGVHYPRDIVGGLIIASLFSVFVVFVLHSSIQVLTDSLFSFVFGL